jgi:hypothetical protein
MQTAYSLLGVLIGMGVALAEYRTIKELVVDTCLSEEGFPSYEKLTALVLQHFPSSKWQKSHYAWYKSQIKNGGIVVPGFEFNAGTVDEQSAESESDVEQVIEASISLERDLHTYLASRLHELEPGLNLVPGGVEYQTEAGRIDILARDSQGQLTVVELKAGKAKDAALGQLLGYMGCLSDGETGVRGLLVASGFEPRVELATRGCPTSDCSATSSHSSLRKPLGPRVRSRRTVRCLPQVLPKQVVTSETPNNGIEQTVSRGQRDRGWTRERCGILQLIPKDVRTTIVSACDGVGSEVEGGKSKAG